MRHQLIDESERPVHLGGDGGLLTGRLERNATFVRRIDPDCRAPGVKLSGEIKARRSGNKNPGNVTRLYSKCFRDKRTLNALPELAICRANFEIYHS